MNIFSLIFSVILLYLLVYHTPLIKSPYSTKDHGKTKQNKTKPGYFARLKLPGAVKSSISWKIRTYHFTFPQAVFLWGSAARLYACNEGYAPIFRMQALAAAEDRRSCI